MFAILELLKHGSPDDTSNVARLWRDTFVEFLATTLFVFNGTLSVTSTGRKLVGQGGIEDVARILPIAMSFGISIMTLAYSIGHITGGHMNPGVSFLMFLRRQMSLYKMICYWGAQLLGAVMGATLLWGCSSALSGQDKGENGEFNRPPFDLGSTVLDGALSTGNGFLLELMGSFFFFFVIAQTALDKKGIAESFFPAIPIGFSLIVVHVCLVPFTGCGVNPARTFGPSMVVCMAGGNCEGVTGSGYWIYYAAPLIAAWAVAEVTFIMSMSVDDDEDHQAIHESANTPENQTLKILKNAQMDGSLSQLHNSFSKPEQAPV